MKLFMIRDRSENDVIVNGRSRFEIHWWKTFLTCKLVVDEFLDLNIAVDITCIKLKPFKNKKNNNNQLIRTEYYILFIEIRPCLI